MTTGTSGLDTGTYEVLRDRLTAQAAELARRAEALNARRTEEFGSTPLELTSTERLRTEHNCVPRDIVSVGDTLLFGHNVFLGLKPETTVGDVFALYDRALNRLPEDAVPGLLDDPAFVREFAALYRYYCQAHLLQLRRVDGKLLAVFQTGEKGDLHAPLRQIRATAEQVLSEFETVQALTRQAADALAEATARVAAVVRRLRGEAPRSAAAPQPG
ncbi:hypothetical protein GCM10023083_29120 [Streptomyces phyllanthi]